MQNGRKVQNSPTILFLSQLLYNVNLMTLTEGGICFSWTINEGSACVSRQWSANARDS